eukprot:2678341-Pyramimonas_sp.AAC.1
MDLRSLVIARCHYRSDVVAFMGLASHSPALHRHPVVVTHRNVQVARHHHRPQPRPPCPPPGSGFPRERPLGGRQRGARLLRK